MADIRAMLRSELASRQAQRTSKKAKHSPSLKQPATKKKRKATSADEETRKRLRSRPLVALPGAFFDGDERLGLHPDSSQDSELHDLETVNQLSTESHISNSDALPLTESSGDKIAPHTRAPSSIDEDEWAAFERDVATPPGEQTLSILNPAATIEAAPMTAREITTKNQEQSMLRSGRDTEVEDEKEDAVRLLEEEFDEMEQLEGRLQKLREQREALRCIHQQKAAAPHPESLGTESHSMGWDQEEERSDEGDYTDDWDQWGFGTT